MKIAIEASFANEKKKTGLGVYTERLLSALAMQADPADTFFLLHSQKEWSGPDYGKNFIPVSYACTGSQFFSIIFRLNKFLKKLNPDLFHIFCNAGSPPRCAIPTVTTVHDLFFLYAKDLPFKTKLILRLLFRWTVCNSVHFISNSETTKRSLVDFGLPEEKITTIYPGADSLKSVPQTAEKPEPYFLCVGALEQRKGQIMLVEAYQQALQLNPDLPDLLLIGPDRGDGAKIRRLIEECPKVRYLDYVTDQELASCYSNASALFFPSYQEGFGLPLIEAMSAGLPVVCSDIPIFREIADPWAVFVSPDPYSFCNAFLDFPSFRFQTGYAQKNARSFTWEKAAAELLQFYRERTRG